MKVKMSVCIDESTYEKVLSLLRSKKFRNKSHVLEYAVEVMSDE